MYTPDDLHGLNAMMPAFAKEGAESLTATDTVDVDRLTTAVDRMIKDGADAISTTGRFGEVSNLLWEEMQTLFEEFQWRGLVYDSTNGVREAFAAGPLTAYSGIDPTSSSLHVGNLIGVMALARLPSAGFDFGQRSTHTKSNRVGNPSAPRTWSGPVGISL